MIGTVIVAGLTIAALRAWARKRAAAADTARRYVSRPLTLTVYNPVDRALSREALHAAQREARETKVFAPGSILRYYGYKGEA